MTQLYTVSIGIEQEAESQQEAIKMFIADIDDSGGSYVYDVDGRQYDADLDYADVTQARPDRVTITFDVWDETFTWGELRKIIDNNTPASGHYRVGEGLSHRTERDVIGGHLAVFFTRAVKPYDKLYPVVDWQYEVANGDTVLGYDEWVGHKSGVNNF